MRDVVMPAPRLDDDSQTTRKWKWHEGVSYNFQPRWLPVINMEGMTLQMLRLLHGLIAHIGWDNQVTVSLGIVGRAIGMHRNTMTWCLRRLEAARLIAVDRSNRKLLRITISPFLAWQGRPHLLYKAREVFEERCRHASDHAVPSAHQQTEPSASLAPSLPSPD